VIVNRSLHGARLAVETAAVAQTLQEGTPMKRILVALDHSSRAATVLASAASLSADELTERLRSEAVLDLERLGAAIEPPKLVVHVLVRIGSPWSAICQSAREHEVDLIVIGSHGYEAVDHVLGTTAAKVVNHADRSVLVVREPKVS
jgi:nucleotide-binding universal stress UspA family protein